MPHRRGLDCAAVRVLVADDDALVRKMLRHLFGDSGFEVIEATTGDEAVRRVAQGDADVVLLDWRLPDGGVGLARSLVADYGMAERVIMLSELSDPRDRRAALEAGVARYFVKPAPLDRLIEAVVEAAHQTQLARATA
jgi:DNA-binding response OmpR family regulator